MADIPAPLANRHTAVVVVAVSLLAAASAVASALVPDDSLVVWLIVVRRLVLAVHAVVIALAVALVARTLVRRSLGTLLLGLLAVGGLLLFALAQVGEVLLVSAWTFEMLPVVVHAVLIAGTAATALGLALLGVAVLLHGAWRGVTRFTLPAAALVTIGGAFFIPLVYAVWSLVLLGLSPGLHTRRSVPNAGVPAIQQGAAEV